MKLGLMPIVTTGMIWLMRKNDNIHHIYHRSNSPGAALILTHNLGCWTPERVVRMWDDDGGHELIHASDVV